LIWGKGATIDSECYRDSVVFGWSGIYKFRSTYGTGPTFPSPAKPLASAVLYKRKGNTLLPKARTLARLYYLNKFLYFSNVMVLSRHLPKMAILY